MTDICIYVPKVIGKSTDVLSLAQAAIEGRKLAREGGCLAHCPKIIETRMNAPISEPIWQDWHTALTEEDGGKDEKGREMVVVSHGSGLHPVHTVQDAAVDIRYYAEFAQEHFIQLLKGSKGPIYHYDDFAKMTEFPLVYGVFIEADKVKNLPSGVLFLDKLRGNKLYHMRVGSIKQAHGYLDVLQKAEVDEYGNWHSLQGANYDQPFGRLLAVNSNRVSGLVGYIYDSSARFFGVFPSGAAEGSGKKIEAPAQTELEGLVKNAVPVGEHGIFIPASALTEEQRAAYWPRK